MRLALAAALAALTAAPAAAQSWTASAADDGVWFNAIAVAGVPMTLDLECGGPSPEGKPLTGDHYEALRTEPGTLRVSLGQGATGLSPSVDLDARPAIRLTVDGRAVQHPPFDPNGLDDLFEINVPTDHPLVTALATGNRAAVSIDGRNVHAVALTGSGRAIAETIAYCAARQ